MKDTNEQAGISVKLLSKDEISKIESFRKSRQTAVLTILFSDIVNSSYATEKLGEETYSNLRHIHDELFTKIMCSDNAGVIIKQIGDSFLCVFAEPSTAVLRAIEFQRAVHANKQHLTANNYTLTVRIGINLGQVVVENALAMDIFGTHVNRSARMEAIAHGGQIITSQSVWENAAGWLKDHDDKNIGCAAYGKVKLKGIEKAVEVYGFYPKEFGKPKTPKAISFKKNKNATLIFFLVIIAATSIGLLMKEFNKKSSINLSVAGKKTYYIQFDFSAFKNTSNKVDTTALEQDLLTQVITVLSPDSVITEDDLIKKLSEKGKLYTRYKNNEPDSSSTSFFMDTLYLSGSLFIKAFLPYNQQRDSLEVSSRLVIYEKTGTSSGTTSTGRDHLYGLQNAGDQLRNDLQDMLLSTRHWDIQGYVLSSNDSLLLFRTTKDAQLRQGTAITFFRGYKEGKEGLQNRLNDLQRYINFYAALKDSDAVNNYKEEYRDFENKLELEIKNTKHFGSFGTGIGINGKVIEMYDSTGKAVWHTTSSYPEKPKPGDIIYYK